MKIYVVTDGCYSDYGIERIFSNRDAAEEYRKWRHIDNAIEEYDLYDEPFTREDGKKAMFIKVQGTVYPEAVVDFRYEIRPSLVLCPTGGSGIFDYKKPGVFTLYTYHYILADQWDEEKYKAKFTKSLYDLAGMVKAMFAEGASVQDVALALRGKYEAEV